MLEIFAIIFSLLLIVYKLSKRHKNLPPGPKPVYPIVGNLPVVAGKDVLKTFRDLRAQYGDIFTLYFGHQLMIVVNGYEMIKEVLVKYGDYFSERPDNFITQELSKKRGLIFSSGKDWKEHRVFITSALKELGFGKVSFEECIKTEAMNFLEYLDGQGGHAVDVKKCLFACVTNITLNVVVGKRCQYDDPEFQEFLQHLLEISRLVGSASVLVNCFPYLRHCPCDPLKMRLVKDHFSKFMSFFAHTYEEHRKSFNRDYIRDFVDLYISEMERRAEEGRESTFTEPMLQHVIGDLLGAGGETSTTALSWAFLYLLRHPEVQTKVREEIRNLVGAKEIPSYLDRHKLPFLEATVLEVFRLGDVVPLAMPHGVLDDVVYNGYTIPKEASVLINLSSISHDPLLFENPTKFDPLRFIDANGRLKSIPELIPFSTGRRRCVGSNVARMQLFIFISAVLNRFELLAPEGESPPEPIPTLGVTNLPPHFKLVAVHR